MLVGVTLFFWHYLRKRTARKLCDFAVPHFTAKRGRTNIAVGLAGLGVKT